MKRARLATPRDNWDYIFSKFGNRIFSFVFWDWDFVLACTYDFVYASKAFFAIVQTPIAEYAKVHDISLNYVYTCSKKLLPSVRMPTSSAERWTRYKWTVHRANTMGITTRFHNSRLDALKTCR